MLEFYERIINLPWIPFFLIIKYHLRGSLSLDDILSKLETWEELYFIKRARFILVKSSSQNDFPPFRSLNMWKMVLKYLEKAIYRGIPRTIVKTRMSPLFKPSLSSSRSKISPFGGFFTIREDFVDCAFTWTKYKIKGVRNYIYIFDTRGERHFLGNGSWCNNFFLRNSDHEIKIFTDTPWNDDFLIFKASFPFKLRESLIDIYETKIGIIISVSCKNGNDLWNEVYYKVDFKRQTLETIVLISDILTHSIVSAMGICSQYRDNGRSIYAFNSEDYEFLSRHYKMSTTGSIDIGIIEAEEYSIYDLNLKKQLWTLSYSYYMKDFNKYFSFGFPYPFLIDLLIITVTKVYDLATGRVLFDTSILKKSADEKDILISSVVRKDDETGYYIQLNSEDISFHI